MSTVVHDPPSSPQIVGDLFAKLAKSHGPQAQSTELAAIPANPANPDQGTIVPAAPDHPIALSSGHHGHSHGHAEVLASIDFTKDARAFIVAHVLEVGIAIHSVIIGVALGVTTASDEFNPLLTALCFHQFFEGLALGGALIMSTKSRWVPRLGPRSLPHPAAPDQSSRRATPDTACCVRVACRIRTMIMGAFFSTTTPVGVIIGIAVSSSYEEGEQTSLALQGIFDSIAGGILVYMALVDLIAEVRRVSHCPRWISLTRILWQDFKDAYMHKHNPNLKYTMLVGVTLGALCMAILALWA